MNCLENDTRFVSIIEMDKECTRFSLTFKVHFKGLVRFVTNL